MQATTFHNERYPSLTSSSSSVEIIESAITSTIPPFSMPPPAHVIPTPSTEGPVQIFLFILPLFFRQPLRESL